MNTSPGIRGTLTVIAAALFLLPAASAHAQFGAPGSPDLRSGARVWLDGRDELRRGDRLDIRFSLPTDAHVALIHVDPDGTLDFLYPSSPYRTEYLMGGRVYSLAGLGQATRTVRSSRGIGYLYLIASPRPLDFSYFRGPVGTGWYWGHAGRAVHGDPFLAFEQISRLVVPGWPSAAFVSDYYGYYVAGYHQYPVYACSDRLYSSGWGWTGAYGPCAQQDRFLQRYPYYYDTRRYVGDRRTVLRQYERLQPVHRYKEAPGSWTRQVPTRSGSVPATRGDGFVPSAGGSRGTPAANPPPARANVPSAGRGTTRDAGDGSGAQGRARPAPTSRDTPASGRAGTPTTNRAAGGVNGAPTTNRAAGRGAGSPSAGPSTSRGRP